MRLITRAGLDWTHRYGDLPDAFRALPCRAAMIDGEIVVPDDGGRHPLRRCCRTPSRAGAGNRLVFFAFDLLHLDGWDLTAAPLAPAQGAARASCSPATPANAAIQFSDHVDGGGAGFFEQRRATSASKASSPSAPAPYTPGRSKTWVKAKAPLTGDFVIAGFTRSAADGGLGALALARVGRTASSSTAARSAPASTPPPSPTLLARLEPLRRRRAARRRARRTSSGCARP